MKRTSQDISENIIEEKPGLTKGKGDDSKLAGGKPKEAQSVLDINREFYLNILINYKSDDLLPHMVKFINIFFKKLHSEGLSEKRSLKNAFMTCFGFEGELLTSVIENTKKFLLLNDSSDGVFELKEKLGGNDHFTLILPSKIHMGYGYGAFHPKLWLIEFDDNTLRVVVGTGNLSIGDWTVWSNCLWYKDFQQKSFIKQKDDIIIEGHKSTNDFGEYLSNFVNKLFPKGIENLSKFGGISLENYDFKVKINPHLIASISGRHYISGNQEFRYGFDRLSQITRENPPKLKNPPTKKRIVYQTSSVGQLSSSFLIRFLGSLS